MEKKITVGILEDHPAIAAGYKSKLESDPRVQVGWIANYYQDVIPSLNEHPTDAIILDIHVYNAPGDVASYPALHAIPDLLEKYPALKIIVISMIDRPALIKAIQKAGANGYILKSDGDSYDQLAGIILDIVENDTAYYSPDAARIFSPEYTLPTLTRRQSQVLALMASNPGMSYQEIAEALYISVNTVRNHVADICTALGVNNRSNAVLRAKQIGLVTPDSV